MNCCKNVHGKLYAASLSIEYSNQDQFVTMT